MALSGLTIAIVAGLLAFAGGIAGLYLQRLLPERHTTERSRDMIGAVNSLLALLLALVLGTGVSSGYSFFLDQKSEVGSLAAHAIELDMALARYGPEAHDTRVMLKEAMIRGHQLFWQSDGAASDAMNVALAEKALNAMSASVGALEPNTALQRDCLTAAQALLAEIADTRIKMSLQLAAANPWPLLTVLAAWALVLFCGYGLMSRLNAMTLSAMAFGAFAIASALFLIIEARQPYNGFMHVPDGALAQAIEAMGKQGAVGAPP